MSLFDAQIVRRQNAIQDMVAVGFRRDIYLEKNRYIKQAADFWIKHQTMNEEQFVQHRENMERIFKKHGKRMIKLMHREVAMMAKSLNLRIELKIDDILDDDVAEGYFEEWYTKRGGGMAVETSRTTRKDINRAIQAAYQSEDGEAAVLKRILRAQGLSAFRAATISRTETHNAAMFSSVSTARDLQETVGLVIYKKWIPVEDERTREHHKEMENSEAIPIDASFLVGGEYVDRPSDGSAFNTINCRCGMVYESR